MKRPYSFPIATIFFVALLIVACGNEEKLNRNSLLGSWEIANATRDGRRAPSVEGLFFTFFEDGTMQTNIAGSAETATYKIDELVIQQRESRLEIDYVIEELSDTSLVMTTELRNSHFRFFLKKVATEQ